MTVIREDQIIWFPGIYNGREGLYTRIASDVTQEVLIDLVQKRAKEDGEWAIENDLVGDNEDKMRQMMAWVSDPKHIVQCYEYGDNQKETVDWICRDLANASKWIGGSDG